MSDTDCMSLTNKAKVATKVRGDLTSRNKRVNSRKNFICLARVPDFEKSTIQYFQDRLRGNVDLAASTAQKSYTQKLGDKFSSNPDNKKLLTPIQASIVIG